MRSIAILFVVALASVMNGCGDFQNTLVALPVKQSASATSPAAEDWSAVAKALGRKGTVNGDVYHVTVPRDDLFVSIEGMEVPTQAGLSSDFWFYRCSCGHISLVGQFTVADYESNDVIDALRAGQMKIAALAPMLQYEKPHLLLIRFQGEGDAGAMAKTLREALRWTGKERMAPRKMN
ncbi:MAG TPA: DUF1259 domain-containing protein [Tepidisphaeraceae bacterium]|nr:DUF1259 domain-containing protein [Tepidisphaeraceae bacterium]